MNLWVIIVLFCCDILCKPTIAVTRSHPITTLINAKWIVTPVHLEVAEYLAEEDPSLYWEYLEVLDKDLISTATNEKQYLQLVDTASEFLAPGQISLLKLSLSLKTYTPLVQAHLQIANELTNGTNCDKDVFYQIGSKISCSLDNLKTSIIENSNDNHDVELFTFDHIYPGSLNNNVTVILYGQIGTQSFAEYHDILKDLAKTGVVKYVVRNYMKVSSKKKVRLSGYGVEMHLKSTEYKSMDDSPNLQTQDDSSESKQNIQNEIEGINFEILKNRFPNLTYSLERLQLDLLDKQDVIEPLKAWEFQELSLKAANRIAEIQGEEALSILQVISQNFPSQAKTLLHINVKDDFKKEIQHNTDLFARNLNLQPPDAALFVNGLFFDADTLDIYSLLDTLRSESRILDGLFKIGFSGISCEPLLSLSLAVSSKEFAIDIRDSSINWINDIENDMQYKRWSSSVFDLLRPTFPGMMRNIRKNLFNLVLVVDPLIKESRNLIKLVESFVLHSAPVRVGILMKTLSHDKSLEDAYRAITCAFNYIVQQQGQLNAMAFLSNLFNNVEQKDVISYKDIEKELSREYPKLIRDDISDILGEDSTFDYGRTLADEFIERLGVKSLPQALLNGVLLSPSLLNSDDFEEAVLSEIMRQTTILQKAVYRGELDDNLIPIDYLMSQPHVVPRLNERILSTETSSFLDMTGTAFKDIENVNALAQLSLKDMTATLMDNLKYFGNNNIDGQLHYQTLWVVSDLNTLNGKTTLLNALKFMKSTKGVRVSFIPNADNLSGLRNNNLNSLVWSALNTLNTAEATELVIKILKTEDLASFSVPENVKGFLRVTELHLKMLRVFSQRVLNMRASTTSIVANGKIIGPFDASEFFQIEDYSLLEKFLNYFYIDKIKETLAKSHYDTELNSDVFLRLCSLLVTRQNIKTRYSLPLNLKEDRTVVKLNAKHEHLPSFLINAIVDPASKGAQKLSSILLILRKVVNCNLKLYLYAVEKHSDMPVKNYYRFVTDPEIQFNDEKYSEGPVAKFMGLPPNSLLTQSLIVPENWLIEVVRSVYDLDNIKLADINGPVHSEYELEHLLLEGHCFDSTTGAPPRGLQFTLGTKNQPVIVDTIVMANLGYFQLKANPGAWDLRLRHGKSSDIYDVTNAEGPNTKHSKNQTRVIISSFRSTVLKIKVTKKPKMQDADLLSDVEESTNSGIWNSITSTITGDRSTKSETINIFSVASGHLYERLLRIMMLSLLKHTKSPVKFWFLKNYLSPQFIDFLPHMAKQYNFEYELVQYKWPRWLHQQAEKQRVIWGYKILFLDVLFPLDVKKIIFVDADQIVRADIKELHDFNLGGAPYGYTPFCDSRKEMEGFRFWKVGYWKNHLQGKPYHISALYVVDLVKFRKIAAGDRLRGQYQALSQDPNSLSNLDQDLPNNMIHQVPIKSLPPDWLWCETWCSSDSLKTAKTIDLCNNPQTKEAKLDAAQRIVPEWKEYDSEIKRLMVDVELEVENELSKHSKDTRHDAAEL